MSITAKTNNLNWAETKFLTPVDRPIGYKYVVLSSKVEVEEGGYYEWPVMVVRWSKVAGAKWGKSPAHDMMANIHQLNDLRIQTAEARSLALEPPMKGTDRAVIGDLDMRPRGLHDSGRPGQPAGAVTTF